MPILPVSLIAPKWDQFGELLPDQPDVNPRHPLGCHRRRIPDRVVFDHVIAALVHGSGYERIAPPGCSDRTIRRRVREWAEAGLAEELHALALVTYDRMIGLELDDLAVAPLAASIGKELRTWFREPRYALELRVAIYAGVLLVAITAVAGFPQSLPFAGVAIVFIAVAAAANSYGLDGTAFWVPFMTSGGIRLDVGGKQWSFLLLLGPISIAFPILFIVVSGEHWAWPWVGAILPSMLGTAAGVMILTSVLGAAPVPAAARRSGSLMASADNVGAAYIAWIITAIAAAIPALMIAAGLIYDNERLLWLAAPVGIAVIVAIMAGSIAIRRLANIGPELLDLMRNPEQATAQPQGAMAQLREAMAASGDAESGEHTASRASGLSGLVAKLCWWTFWIPPGPIGIASLGIKLAGGDYQPWMPADHVSSAWEWPVIILPIGLGIGRIVMAVVIERRAYAMRASS